VEANAVNGRNADGSRDNIFYFLELAVERVESLDDLLAVIVKDLPLTREPKVFFAALDQERLEQALERTDLLADGGLGDVVDLGGLGKALGFGQIAEDFQTLDLHKNREYLIAHNQSTYVFLNWR